MIGNLEASCKIVEELEKYLIERYNARVESEIDESRINTIKYRIVHKYYNDLIQGERVIVDNREGLTKEIEKELLDEMSFIRSIPNEQINLDLVNYEFDIYKDSFNIGKFEVLIDRTTLTVYPEYLLKIINDDCNREMLKICGDILLLEGFTTRDREEKTERYMDHITTKLHYERDLKGRITTLR